MYNLKRNALGCLLAAACLLLPTAGISAADDDPDSREERRQMRQQLREACRESAKSLCTDARGGRERLRCLLDNYEDVPEDCQVALDVLQEEREHRREMLETACGASMDSACPGREEGPGMVRCLKNNYDQVSADCQAFLDEIPDRRSARVRGGW